MTSKIHSEIYEPLAMKQGDTAAVLEVIVRRKAMGTSINDVPNFLVNFD